MDYEYRKLSDLKPGDLVHRWGDDLKVIYVSEQPDGSYALTCWDNGRHQKWFYPKDAEVLILRGENGLL